MLTPRFVLQIHTKGCNESCHASILSTHCTRASSTLAGAIATSGTPPPGRGAPGCHGACQCDPCPGRVRAVTYPSHPGLRLVALVAALHLRAAACRQTRCVAPVWLGEASAWSRATCLWHSVITVCVKAESIDDFNVSRLVSSISGDTLSSSAFLSCGYASHPP